MFAKQLDRLGQQYYAVSYDRRGFGQSTSPDESFSQVADLSAVLDSFGIEAVNLVGCSQGGRIAIDFALANRGRVESLVLVATALSGAPSPKIEGRSLMLAEALEDAEEREDIVEVNRIEAHLWLDGPESEEGRVSGQVRDLFLDMNAIALQAPELTRERDPPSALERIGEITCPVLLIEGGLDFGFIKELHSWLDKALVDSRRAVIKEAAHLPNLEHPDVFNRLLTDFLGRR